MESPLPERGQGEGSDADRLRRDLAGAALAQRFAGLRALTSPLPLSLQEGFPALDSGETCRVVQV
ncbi:hypothetical protein AXW83_07215 [Bosea sp. PAMC 26642]|nr:hypothetical protein AXW83_07215 [Bosea sp. PAMC 26642]